MVILDNFDQFNQCFFEEEEFIKVFTPPFENFHPLEMVCNL